LERLAKPNLSAGWSVVAGNDGYTALFVHKGEPSVRLAQRLAAEMNESVVVLNFDDDLYYSDEIRDDGSEHRLAEGPAAVLAAHGINVPGDEEPVIYRAAFAVGVDRAALEAIGWGTNYEAHAHGRGVLVTGGGSLGTSSGRWSRKLNCEVFFASWEPATHTFLCRHIAPGIDELLRWRDRWVDGAIGGATEPASVLRVAEIPPAMLGMNERSS